MLKKEKKRHPWNIKHLMSKKNKDRKLWAIESFTKTSFSKKRAFDEQKLFKTNSIEK